MSNAPEADFREGSGSTVSPFAGLVPSRVRAAQQSEVAPALKAPSRSTRHVLNTVPIVLVGSLALATLNLTGALDVGAAQAKRAPRPDSNTSDLSATVGAALAAARSTSATSRSGGASLVDSTISTAAVVVPAHYTVRHGDTVSEIAGRYHLSTASVLALNGLSWKSTIFPGQVLKLTKAATTAPAKAATPPAKAATPPAKSSTPTTSTGSTSYTIKSGDTITSIAKHFGVSVTSVLSANHLTATSIIYAGRKLVIPGKGATVPPVAPPVTAPPVTAPPTTAPAQVGTVVTPLSPEMQANATVVIQVGRRLGVPDYGIVVALAAAAQESGLRNLAYGDLDSVGLFQQRPSTGWGTVAQLENTTYASELFYGGPSNPNKGKTRGLLDIKGWQSMTVTQAAQAVQVSAQPNAYAKWETSARAWLAQLG